MTNSKSERKLPSYSEIYMPLCYQCYEEGFENELEFQKMSQTVMAVNEFYDDDGLHHHDPNVISTYYKCSEGHELVLMERSLCPICNWPNDNDD